MYPYSLIYAIGSPYSFCMPRSPLQRVTPLAMHYQSIFLNIARQVEVA